ncbi:uncharacterized protein PAC_14247 [Phialocephala subalpina]|uniref:Uncharacterized protein n=1 Tax=Phialocephala subalpina TaxID=576137 RepID=A0A1L7XH26_9HELO|nr:uncharacterized protein PAC_14247 [Phialocephala subalpina]
MEHTDGLPMGERSKPSTPPLERAQQPMEGRTRRNAFAGRLSGNQVFVLDRDASSNGTIRERMPDAAPLMSWSEQFALGSFRQLELWKAGLAEGRAKFSFATLFILSFSAVSGGHLNQTITFGTLFGRLCTFPRLVIYVGFQTIGTMLAGLLVRKELGGRDFKVGGCWLATELVSVSDAFVIEFMACSVLTIISFGMGLDPR